MTEMLTDEQQFEAAWWGDCTNTFGEEAKQITYAHRMGLANVPRDGRWPVYDLVGASVLDLGGGPVSMLLKTVNGRRRMVVDPCPYPGWVSARYAAAGIEYARVPAETFLDVAYGMSGGRFTFDECWIYNTLQHVIDPESVIGKARERTRLLRIFEWVEHPACEGHPHVLHAHDLNAWIGGVGDCGYVDENGAVGLAYWGVFDL